MKINLFKLLVIYAQAKEKDCNDLPLCKANQFQPICVLDIEKLCFQSFPSSCLMEQYQCLLNKSYINYHLMYCNIYQFLCKEYPWLNDEYDADGKNSNVFDYHENPQKDVEIILQESNNNNMNNSNEKDKQSNLSFF
uniref:Uncharacterized protein n=1 Tax=Glossina brevipalpis TaxID=37001 RepID=A0A1A9W379_9MUSC